MTVSPSQSSKANVVTPNPGVSWEYPDSGIFQIQQPQYFKGKTRLRACQQEAQHENTKLKDIYVHLADVKTNDHLTLRIGQSSFRFRVVHDARKKFVSINVNIAKINAFNPNRYGAQFARLKAAKLAFLKTEGLELVAVGSKFEKLSEASAQKTVSPVSSTPSMPSTPSPIIHSSTSASSTRSKQRYWLGKQWLSTKRLNVSGIRGANWRTRQVTQSDPLSSMPHIRSGSNQTTSHQGASLPPEKAIKAQDDQESESLFSTQTHSSVNSLDVRQASVGMSSLQTNGIDLIDEDTALSKETSYYSADSREVVSDDLENQSLSFFSAEQWSETSQVVVGKEISFQQPAVAQEPIDRVMQLKAEMSETQTQMIQLLKDQGLSLEKGTSHEIHVELKSFMLRARQPRAPASIRVGLESLILLREKINHQMIALAKLQEYTSDQQNIDPHNIDPQNKGQCVGAKTPEPTAQWLIDPDWLNIIDEHP